MSLADTLSQITRATGNTVSRVTDFVARLSFWRFVGLCVLLLIATGIADDLFFDTRRHHATIRFQTDDGETPTEKSPPAPPAPKELTLPKDPDAEAVGTDQKGAEKPFEIRIGGEDGIVIRGEGDPKNLEKIGSSIEKRIDEEIARQAALDRADAESDGKASFSLPSLAMLMIVLMIIVRFVTKSKVRAEERAASAEVAADTADLSRQLAEAKLQAMQAQVEPHFLFNTLAAVEHLIETDPPRAAAMQRNLIAYLRSVLPNLRQSDSTLGREADIARNYLEILKFRMEDRLDFAIDIPAGIGSAAMPPLMLQSLVENAIQHGLEPLPEGGRIDVRAEIHDGQLRVQVADTGSGFVPGSDGRRAQSGVGLASIRERLAALFGDKAHLIIEANTPRGTRVTIEFPYTYKATHAPHPSPDRR